ncbi:hypothetical protein HDU97_003163 [Phlyctochytrium planicorne]|nr:hypothetical protein HDU97_003163 [Phlyctochytrium planicorne]
MQSMRGGSKVAFIVMVVVIVINLTLFVAMLRGKTAEDPDFSEFDNAGYNSSLKSDCVNSVANASAIPTPIIPKTIWTFWDSADPPEFVRECIYGWKRTNPDYEVIVLGKDSLSTYIKTPLPNDNSNPQAFSDWVRLAVLSERGGVWLDASVILTGSLRPYFELQEKNKSEVFAFHLNAFTSDFSKPIVESWFIATVPRGKYITSWFNEFNKIFVNFDMKDTYLDFLKDQYGEAGYEEIRQKNNMASYLKIHMASQKILAKDGVPVPFTLPAEEGPYLLLDRGGWSDGEVAKQLVGPWKDEKNPPIVIKLRGGGRRDTIKLLEDKTTLIDKTSVYAKFVKFRDHPTIKQVKGLVHLSEDHAKLGDGHDHKDRDKKFMEEEILRDSKDGKSVEEGKKGKEGKGK